MSSFQTEFIRHNKKILPGVISNRFPQLRFANGDLVYTIPDLDPGVRTVLKEDYTHVGESAIVAGDAQDIPLVDFRGGETEAKVLPIMAAYGYTQTQLEAARYNGTPLTNRRAMGARRSIDELANRIAAYGSAVHGVTGLLNHPVVPQTNSSFDFFDSGTGVDDILDFLVGEISAVEDETDLTETVSDILLPPEIYNHLMGKRIDGTSTTLLTYLREALAGDGQTVTLRKVTEVSADRLAANGVGVADKHRIVFYNRSDQLTHERHVEVIRAMEIEGPINGRYVQPLLHRVTGVLINYPQSLRYTDVPVSS